MEKTFPNGFISYLETHYEIVQGITIEMVKDIPTGIVAERYAAQGHGGLYELAEELTDKFELANQGSNWGDDINYFEEIEKFLNKELKLQIDTV